MFGIDDIALALGAAKMVPKAWGAIAGLFGKKTPETVIEAGKLIDGVQAEIQSGRVSPEQQVELKKLLLENEQVKAQMELEKLRLQYEDQAGGREVIRAGLASDDPYVRQTRPRILRRLFTVCEIYVFFAPIAYLVALRCGLKAPELETLIKLLIWIGGFLFTTFTSAFTGYTIVRSKFDKQGLPSDLPSLANAAMGLLKRG